MTLFVDASALIAIVGGETERETFAQAIAEDAALWSPLSRWEAIVGFTRSYDVSAEEAQARLDTFASENGMTLVSIGAEEAEIALDAHRRFGRRSGHRAQLNLGDCFAYACAKANQARLLYKGNDFAQTDLANA